MFSSEKPPLQQSQDHGQFEGGSYAITHRDASAVLTLTLKDNAIVASEMGAMIHMSGTITLDAESKSSFRSLFSSEDQGRSLYIGPGSVALGPELIGDIVTLSINNTGDTRKWSIRKQSSLAYTTGVILKNTRHSFRHALFHDEPLYIYEVAGSGLLWLKGLGAVDRIDLETGQTHFVDSGHLVAWNCNYKLVKAGGNRLVSSASGEGRILHFEGPGTVYIAARKYEDWIEFVQCFQRNS
ncbi:unnamed protein product [Clonostachys solani]|uniref:Altered inheritance of mitochondria protein 24, mitochondrial n=1 Tax=Clonostachys solani TaxID=160281 RepID=A0A9N9Z2Q2_9HYPO|nr:unnamed protein product [Clonostachys solani]